MKKEFRYLLYWIICVVISILSLEFMKPKITIVVFCLVCIAYFLSIIFK